MKIKKEGTLWRVKIQTVWNAWQVRAADQSNLSMVTLPPESLFVVISEWKSEWGISNYKILYLQENQILFSGLYYQWYHYYEEVKESC